MLLMRKKYEAFSTNREDGGGEKKLPEKNGASGWLFH